MLYACTDYKDEHTGKEIDECPNVPNSHRPEKILNFLNMNKTNFAFLIFFFIKIG